MVERLAHQKQPEGQRLRERRGEQRVESLGVVTGRLRVRVQHLAELIADDPERRVGMAGCVEFGEAVGDDAAHEPGCMREVARQLFGVFRRRRIGECEWRQCGEKPCGIDASDQSARRWRLSFRR